MAPEVAGSGSTPPPPQTARRRRPDPRLLAEMADTVAYAELLWTNYVVGLNRQKQTESIYAPVAKAIIDAATGMLDPALVAIPRDAAVRLASRYGVDLADRQLVQLAGWPGRDGPLPDPGRPLPADPWDVALASPPGGASAA